MLKLICAVALVCGTCACVSAQTRRTPFAGAVAGISTLSADASAKVGGGQAEASLYKPENGAALNLVAGLHLGDYFSVQGNYVWNRNALTLSTLRTADEAFFEERRESVQHSFIGDALLYFRNGASWARPYLSAGFGLVRFESGPPALVAARGALARPPTTFAVTDPVLRVAVGIDIGTHTAGPWRFRYSFSETISSNPISAQLSPPPPRNLANFQNLFGVIALF